MSVYEVDQINVEDFPPTKRVDMASHWGGQLDKTVINNIRLSFQGIGSLAEELKRSVDCSERRKVFKNKAYNIASSYSFDQIVVEAPIEIATFWADEEQLLPANPILISWCPTVKFQIRAHQDGEITIKYKMLYSHKRDELKTKHPRGLIFKSYKYQNGKLKVME